MLNIGKNHTKHMKMTSTKPGQIPPDLRAMSLRVLMKSDGPAVAACACRGDDSRMIHSDMLCPQTQAAAVWHFIFHMSKHKHVVPVRAPVRIHV